MVLVAMAEELLRSQRNDVLRAIEFVGMSPDAFEWTTTYSRHLIDDLMGFQRIPALQFRDDRKYFFAFDERRGSAACHFSPGKESVVEEQFPGSWDYQKHYVVQWLSYLAREVQAPDLWEELCQLPVGESKGIVPAEKELLTASERQAVLEAVERVRGLLEGRRDLEVAERTAMVAVLGRVAEAAERSNRGQFAMIVWGAIASALAAQLITAANGKWLLGEVQTAVTWIPVVVRAMLAGP
jgi:hypothetical protein